MFVDLHIHSYFSDGAQTPEQAALLCRDSGVGLAALCDHNSWLGCERFAAACRNVWDNQGMCIKNEIVEIEAEA